MTAYSHRDVARIFRISPARLRYWERIELVRPSAGSADAPAFGFRDLVSIKTILTLLERGVSLRRIRRSVDALRARIPELDEPVASLRIGVDGSDRVVIQHGGAWIEPTGQALLDFRLPPAERPTVTELRPPAAAGADGAHAARLWFERGCALDSDPETQAEAIEAYRRAIAADPAFADAHCNLGVIYFQQGQRARARRCFERALAENPHHVEAHLNLGGVLEEAGLDAAALRHYRAALECDPLRAEGHLGAALVCERLGLRRPAREHWRRYLQLRPDGAWAEIARRQLEE